ncbi:hypothetical protein [Fulvimarina sp. MAC3]|uniref:hypothetical protein n=1 Tax=Fulvimarina sp. MAC3 TaxID=3148887 RepID=UPI0031FBD875
MPLDDGPIERAVGLVHAAGLGTVASLLATPEDERDPSLSHLAGEAVLASITLDPSVHSTAGVTSLALGLRAHLNDVETLSPGERLILDELLARIADRPS